jgi:hypothetical protein
MSVVIEPVPDCPDASVIAHKLEVALQTAFSLRIPVSLVAPGTLPRFELKAKRWLKQA